MVYSFSHLKTSKSHDIYRCIRCQAQGTYVKIRVVGEEFMEDPCSIGHICLTRNVARETDTRKFYEDMQNVRKDENYVSMRTKQVWYKGLRERNEADLQGEGEMLRKELLAEYYHKGFKKRKRQIARNLAKHKDKRANMEFVPRDLETLFDGSLFLQERNENFHIYYSAETRKQACTIGLYALVADGVHSPQPKELGRGSQLYCIHGVSGNATEIEGCAFHMAQASNRRRDKLGLAKYITGKARDRRIARWWETLKGLVFLPKRLRSAVRALGGPPVPRGHQSYRKCQSFLRYLRTTWMSGSFKDLWCKWGIKELRTTNLAEAFHSSLQRMLNCDHPPLATLIKALKDPDLKRNARYIGWKG
ncbi:hypothetical protein ANCCAN_19650 [Ancylostoma caninum]|uniref:Uncharacterized protein n=1 Tax=Ancylostoma caninum TaxID=29170 RepID=A0A368FQL6_ANCCA|nr:hypothetical protein ANCCAN_19650 [Ancylostoma caninum]